MPLFLVLCLNKWSKLVRKHWNKMHENIVVPSNKIILPVFSKFARVQMPSFRTICLIEKRFRKLKKLGKVMEELKSQDNWRLQLPLCGTQCLTDKFSENRGFWKAKQAFAKWNKVFTIRVITKLPNSEQSYKGKVKTHNYINIIIPIRTRKHKHIEQSYSPVYTKAYQKCLKNLCSYVCYQYIICLKSKTMIKCVKII